MILLRSATRITHKAQGATCLAAKWHALAAYELVVRRKDGDYLGKAAPKDVQRKIKGLDRLNLIKSDGKPMAGIHWCGILSQRRMSSKCVVRNYTEGAKSIWMVLEKLATWTKYSQTR
ncbi:hypothetical protein CTI12_AA112830 [Artemisia annua]|uniref:Uncharacterized protein n=1 Tax=Artemisia annua TaxID=35608 RepID=A0A2U1PU26_ARTAN|nr:hypothetical protein CTI12_AA112830 [Artemisia annua]